MNDTPSFHTRRQFLRTSVLGGAMTWTLPAFLNNTFLTLEAAAADSALQTATGKDHPILVVLQLAGGNDGLNTVTPFGHDAYYQARPRLALGKDVVLKLNDAMGLHPSLTNLHRFFQDGKMAVLQNVGYPNPNRSHFRSMEIWQTASDADRVATKGWLGSYFDNACSGEDAAVGISLGRQLPQAFSGDTGKGVASAVTGRQQGNNEGPSMMEDGATITDFAGEGAVGGDVLDFLRRTDLDATVSSAKISEITNRIKIDREYPPTALGQQLKVVSQLIAGGMSTRVYYATQGGYDTHSNQHNTHERLLNDLDAALGAFVQDLQARGDLDRVLVMTFSEFGRRVAENASGGTDHGAAAPMFLLGGGSKPGLWGSSPDLLNLDRGDLRYEVDFRSVYATILDRWLKASSQQVLGRSFQAVPILG